MLIYILYYNTIKCLIIDIMFNLVCFIKPGKLIYLALQY